MKNKRFVTHCFRRPNSVLQFCCVSKEKAFEIHPGMLRFLTFKQRTMRILRKRMPRMAVGESAHSRKQRISRRTEPLRICQSLFPFLSPCHYLGCTISVTTSLFGNVGKGFMNWKYLFQIPIKSNLNEDVLKGD
jgi:hypothetical protein